MSDIQNIILNDDEMNEEQLMNYLKGNLSNEELHNVEKQMANSEFVSDAIEGLQTFSSNSKLDKYVHQLNQSLHQHLINKKQQKEKRKIKDFSWIILSVIIILLLCLLGYVVISLQKKKENNHSNLQQLTTVAALNIKTEV